MFRPLNSSATELALPSFTICTNPFINQTLVQQLGLNQSLWSTYKHQLNNFTDWPIKDSLKDSNLWERTTFRLNDLADQVKIFEGDPPTKINISEDLSGTLLNIKVYK